MVVEGKIMQRKSKVPVRLSNGQKGGKDINRSPGHEYREQSMRVETE